jgi:hypothetical protein
MSGVPVMLVAIDPNGNTIDIGTATTNAYYGDFNFAWAPEIEGTYTIMASFTGDDSYGSSGASTAIIVGAAATPAPTTTVAPVQSNTDMYIAGSTIAIIIAIAIVGLLVLRKRP